MVTVFPEQVKIRIPGGDMELFFDIDEAGSFPVGNVILTESSLPIQAEDSTALVTEQ